MWGTEELPYRQHGALRFLTDRYTGCPLPVCLSTRFVDMGPAVLYHSERRL